METFVRVTGIVAPLLRDNIDTDVLIPSREMTQPGKAGYGEKLMAGWRYVQDADGRRRENPDFVLNRAPFRQACFLVSGANFGSGSSREQAVWALRQFGIRAVFAASFGAIFKNNCYRNGVLPVVLPRSDLESLAAAAETGVLVMTVDLEAERASLADGRAWPLAVPANERSMLLAGLDAIGLTLRLQERITDFQAADRVRRPWIWR
ncbi:3-isopropylmalate dehydratase small subunit [Verticiella sediminum]|uniref:3-isopropylmalate dehydratase n=1 Tax=Verticiella sediminum TaxID=1247510 RepID=A0A556ATZ7_9BURK|nr:3-isopropylmalate dehydratase small subunit [Verticiella sediminum]TSH96400.1 3-isopropylmalate dehydratase small subunit [Verticiella sediminum]